VQNGLSDILQLAELLRLNSSEETVLTQYAGTLIQRAPEFADHFYKWLGSVPAMAQFLESLTPEQLARMKSQISGHYRDMLNPHWSATRQEELAALGRFHHQLGLSVSWISSSYALFVQDLNGAILKLPETDREVLRSALYKRLHLDEACQLGGYRQAHLAGIQLRDGFYEAIRITNQFLGSTGSTSALLHGVAQTLAQRLNLPLVWVGTVDSHTRWLHIRARAGSAEKYARKLHIYSQPSRAEGRGPAGRALATGQVVVTDWRTTDDSFAPWIKRAQWFGITGSTHAAFKTRDGQQGVIAMYCSADAAFPAGSEQLLARLAEDIAVALDRIKTNRILSRLQSYQHALERANRMLLAEPAPHEIYTLLARTILECTDAVLAYVSVIDAEKNIAHVNNGDAQTPSSLPDTVSIDPTVPEGWGVTGQVYRLNAPVIIPDASDDPLLKLWAGSIRKNRHKGFAGFPLRSGDGSPDAVLVVVARQGSYFTAEIQKLLSQLVDNASAALKAHRQRRRLEYMSIHDSLTGLPNRAYFEEATIAALGRVERSGKFLGIGIMDLDHFKEINDTLGHAAGDALLKTVATRLSATLRGGDAAARLGGDEFGILLNLDAAEDLTDAANRLLQAVQQPIVWEQERITVGARMGYTIYPLDKADHSGLLRHADAALYTAKDSSRPIEVFRAGLAKKIEQRFRIRQAFPSALMAGDIEFFLQPQANMRTDTIESVELLARWRDGKNWNSATDFIPVIHNDPGLIRDLDHFAISRALELRSNLMARGFGLRISINIGAPHLLRPTFLEELDRLVGHGSEQLSLRLEVTEESALKNLPLAISRLHAIRERGLSTSLDDFGTGYASLLYAAALPVQELKLGQELIRGLLNNPAHLAVAISTIELARISQKSLIAEGVETVEELETWMRLGGERVQGYCLARPVPTEAFMTWLETHGIQTHARPPAYPGEDVPLLVAQVARRRQLRLLQQNISATGDQRDLRPVPPFHLCTLTHWFARRKSRYGKIQAFDIAEAEHRRMHQRYDGKKGWQTLVVVKHWTRCLDDLVEAIDQELLMHGAAHV
jgi:diguanylate cyclase (GGDEF)-like protein